MCMRLICSACLMVLVLIAGSASAITVTTETGNGADTYLANDSQSGIGTNGPDTTHGAEVRMRAFRQLADVRSKTGYIRFDITGIAGDMSGATLTFDATFLKGGARTVQVYGLTDGDDDFWDESTLTYNTAAGVVPNPPTTLGNCVLDTTKVTLLGTITVPAAGGTYPVTFSSSPADLPLTSFLEADRNGLVTFLFIGTDNEGEIASKEHETFDPPTLDLPNAAMGPDMSAACVNPANGAEDVLRDVVLSWTPGAFAATHNVYLGTGFDDVNAAGAGVLVSQGKDANSYDPPGHLEFGRTYYWRVDEVNDAPDFTVHKGAVWSFVVEPFAREIQNLIATASSSETGAGPENTVNGSGLDENLLHSTGDRTMWLSGKNGPQPTWIQYEFDQLHKLHEMWAWNYNIGIESTIGLGFKAVTVEYSADGADWATLGEFEFTRGLSADGYAHNTTVDFKGAAAKYVRLTPASNWGGFVPQYGLSEVKFFYIPVQASMPNPAPDQNDVNPEALLSWRPGREAASHEVYFSADEQAVVDGSALVDTVSESSYDPASLSLEVGTTYYWKVVEVNQAQTPSAWESDLWSFSTQEYIVIDDFESYTNDSPNRVFQTWIDGWGFSEDEFFPKGHPGNGTGSLVGYDPETGAIMETTIIHGGRQAMPVEYNNVNQPYYSEIERTWETPQDWTVHGADTLQVWVRGNPVGFVQDSPSDITMSAAGTDIYGTADQFTFAYKSLNGDGSIIARVDSIEDTDPWAKAGVMIRQSLAPESSFAGVYATPGNGVRFQGRLLTAGDATSDTSVATAEQIALRAPVWVKLERSGSTFSSFYSTDGSTWTAMSWNPQTITMMGPVYIGLAVTSHNANQATTAVFANASTSAGAGGSWQFAEIGVDHLLNDRDSLYVALKDNAGRTAIVTHSDADAVLLNTWQAWDIPLADFRNGGVNTAAIKTMYIGVGDRQNPSPSGAGMLFIDDIGFGRSAAGAP